MITLIGLGPGDESTLSPGARLALEQASELHHSGKGALYLRTQRHPAAEWLQRSNFSFQAFDSLYNAAESFEAVYTAIANTIVSAAADSFPVAYAVPGHPLFGEESVRQIRRLASEQGIPVRTEASGSFVEAVLSAVGADLTDGCDIRDALTLPEAESLDPEGRRLPGRPDSARNLLLFQVYDQPTASRTKLALMQDYPDDWTVVLVKWAGVPGREQVLNLPLYKIDREPLDHLTSLFVPALPPELRRPRFPELIGMMSRLRAPDGCPWDREQTPKTLRRYMIEETYEAIEAIDSEDTILLREELGDVLLQVVFHAQIAREAGEFDIDDVTQGIVEKLVRRHPHVFGSVHVRDSAEVLKNWERIKRAEKPEGCRPESVLDGVPKGLPALMQAMEVSKRAARVGFEWESLADVLSKIDEEVGELRAELAVPQPDPARVRSELGDLIFSVIQVARWNRLDAEEALREMVARFEKRFRGMERRATASGRQLSDCSAAELDELWEEAKRNV